MCHLLEVAFKKVPLLPKLRGQFAEFLQHHSLNAFVFSTRPPVSVSGTGMIVGAISWKNATAERNPMTLNTLNSPSLTHWPQNINCVPIDYDFRPRLRGRLTLRGQTLRRNPWTFGDRDFNPVLRYLCQHSHFPYLQMPSRVILLRPRERSATTPKILKSLTSVASVDGLSPVTFSAQNNLSRPVSYYAFFKGWLLLSQPPGCLGHSTSFPTEPSVRDLSGRLGLFPFPRWNLAPTVCLLR